MTRFLSTPDDLAALVPDGASVGLAKEPLSPIALARALIRRGARDLHLVTIPTASMVADMLIGAGCVTVVETSGVTLGEFGLAPRFVEAVKAGAVEVRDATCPAVYAALQAGEKGQPFVPIRGIIGSDLLANRPDWKVIENPFAPGDPVVILPPIRPDFALIHALKADRFGNVWVGPRHELKTLAHAAKQSLVTVEEIVEHDLREDEAASPNLVSSLYVAALAEAARGAWPTAAPGVYPVDEAEIASYARAAKSPEGFSAWLGGLEAAPRAAE